MPETNESDADLLTRAADMLEQAERGATETWTFWRDITEGGFVHVGDVNGVIPDGADCTPDEVEINPVAKFYADPDAELAVLLRPIVPHLAAWLRHQAEYAYTMTDHRHYVSGHGAFAVAVARAIVGAS